MTLRVFDAHVGGQGVRIIAEGFPSPLGKDMLEKRAWASQNADQVRRVVMLEPRGHAGLMGVVLTEPTEPGGHAGLLFMDGAGFGLLSVDATLAATAIALERGLLTLEPGATVVAYDTPAGRVRVQFDPGQPLQGQPLKFRNVPCFVLEAGVRVRIGARNLRADIAFGGSFYAVVDAESAGVGIDLTHVAELRHAGAAIARDVNTAIAPTHPIDSRVDAPGSVEGTIFIGPGPEGADLRTVVVRADGGLGRSPAGEGMSAVLAVLAAMGLLDDDHAFVCESLSGARFRGRIVRRELSGDHPAVVPEIEAAAWMTGEQVLLAHPDDPWREGFSLDSADTARELAGEPHEER